MQRSWTPSSDRFDHVPSSLQNNNERLNATCVFKESHEITENSTVTVSAPFLLVEMVLQLQLALSYAYSNEFPHSLAQSKAYFGQQHNLSQAELEIIKRLFSSEEVMRKGLFTDLMYMKAREQRFRINVMRKNR